MIILAVVIEEEVVSAAGFSTPEVIQSTENYIRSNELCISASSTRKMGTRQLASMKTTNADSIENPREITQ